MLPRPRRAAALLGLAGLLSITLLAAAGGPALAGNVQAHDAVVVFNELETSVVAGTTATFELTIANATAATAGNVSPVFTFTPDSWTCVTSGGATCGESGTGDINDFVTLPAGGGITYTVVVSVPPSATGSVQGSLTFTTAGDTDTANDTASDSDSLLRFTDLSITKTDNVTERSPGQLVAYVIDVTNAGPSDAVDPAVSDTLPAALTGATWNCIPQTQGASCTASGSGNLSDTADIPVGGTVRYSISGFLAQGTSGSLVNTATVAAGPSQADQAQSNNSATDTDTVTPLSSVSITIDDGVVAVAPGDTVTYEVVATNGGPSNTTGTVSMAVPVGLVGMAWTCAGTGGATCPASGTGAVAAAAVTLPVDGEATFTVTGTVDATSTTELVATASVTSALTETGLGTVDDTATDTDVITDRLADLGVVKTGPTFVLAGDEIEYLLTITNDGPDAADAVSVTDDLPGGTTFVSLARVSGTAADAVDVPAVGANGTVSLFFDDLPDGDAAVYRLVVDTTTAFDPGDQIVNTATIESIAVEATAASADPDGSDDLDSVTTTVLADSDLSITKTLVGSLVSGTNATWSITVRNNGPDATFGGIVVFDDLPAGLTYVSAGGTGWTCQHAGGSIACGRDASLAVGATSTVNVVTRVTAATGTRITNVASVLSGSFDGDPTDSVASAAATVLTPQAAAAAATGLPRTGGPVDDFVRYAVIAFGLGMVAHATGTLQILRTLPARRRRS